MSNNPSIGNVSNPRTCHIGTKRGEKMTNAALVIGTKIGRVVKASEVVKYLIDNYTDSAITAMTVKGLTNNLLDKG
ncbi:hypothetical protein QYE73_22950 [Pseudomonas mosselii]|uniref:hypothetical protein n=1 Tax=Pseudomonas mosselii TaxID=78327 RepID=UPI0026113775|nr:hypothetical protein [Pseudomonas mosselii]MDN4500151.1 hypothetical protein [Pseudomonas mosselii]